MATLTWVRFVHFVSVWKLRLNYTGSYITIFTMAVLLADVLQRRVFTSTSMFFILAVMTGIILVVSWGLDRFGFYTAELNYSTERNQALKDLINGGRRE